MHAERTEQKKPRVRAAEDLGVPFLQKRPTLDQLGDASKDITPDFYPWQPAGDGKTYEANVFDVKRWRAIYHWLHKYLQE